jgi:uncharacterized protein
MPLHGSEAQHTPETQRTAETQQRTTVRTHDGLRLAGTVVTPVPEPKRTVLLLHGEGATREQNGF